MKVSRILGALELRKTVPNPRSSSLSQSKIVITGHDYRRTFLHCILPIVVIYHSDTSLCVQSCVEGLT
jgi:hypothetical protein